MKIELSQTAYVLGLRRTFGPGVTEVPDFEFDQLNNSHDQALLNNGILKVSKTLWEQKLVLVKLENETVTVIPAVAEKPLDESDEAPVVIEDLPVEKPVVKKKGKDVVAKEV